MKKYPRMVSLLAAAVTATSLALVAPAVAAEDAAVAVTDVSAKAAPAMERRHGPSRIALSRYVRHVSAVPSHLDCAGTWCGRHFVLMVGIAY